MVRHAQVRPLVDWCERAAVGIFDMMDLSGNLATCDFELPFFV